MSKVQYHKGNRVLGIDLDSENVRRCREYAEFVGVDPSRCRFEVLNAYDLPGRDERFDQIIAFEILEHLERDQDMVNWFARLLRPGGVVHISTPHLHRKPYYGEVLSEREDGGHLRLGYTFETWKICYAMQDFR